MSKLLSILLVVVVCLSVSCLASGSRQKAFGSEISTSSTQRSFVFYHLGERFVLQQTNGTDKGNTTTNDGFKIEGWGGWLGFSIVILIFFLFGAVFCFMGYKLFKFIVAVIGFIGGFLVGSLLTMTVANWFSVPADDQYIVEWVALGVGILFGIIIAFASWWFYMVGIFLVGGGVGVVVAFYIFLIGYNRITDPDWLAEVLGWVTAVILFIIFGFLTLKLQKFMIILGSAAIGAFLILVGPLALLEQLVTLDDWVYWIFVGAFAVVWIAGTLVQYRFTALEDWHEETYNIERRSFV